MGKEQKKQLRREVAEAIGQVLGKHHRKAAGEVEKTISSVSKTIVKKFFRIREELSSKKPRVSKRKTTKSNAIKTGIKLKSPRQ